MKEEEDEDEEDEDVGEGEAEQEEVIFLGKERKRDDSPHQFHGRYGNNGPRWPP